MEINKLGEQRLQCLFIKIILFRMLISFYKQEVICHNIKIREKIYKPQIEILKL